MESEVESNMVTGYFTKSTDLRMPLSEGTPDKYGFAFHGPVLQGRIGVRAAIKQQEFVAHRLAFAAPPAGHPGMSPAAAAEEVLSRFRNRF
jgi:hypothetical protein